MKAINLSLSFEVDDSVTADAAIEAVQRMIGVGQEDANRVVEQNEGETEAAKIAVSIAERLSIQPLKARCLVVVSGGVADAVHDECVQVEVLDLDNGDSHASANFADLAVICGAPIEI